MVTHSTVSFDQRDQVMRCSACLIAIYVSRAVLCDPDRFIDALEHAEMEHAACGSSSEEKPAHDLKRDLQARSRMEARPGERMRHGATSQLKWGRL